MLGQRTSVHIKVDTGMHRVGAAPADVPALLGAIIDDPLLRFEGLWTHFPVADGASVEDRSFTLRQLGLFDGVIDEMARADVHPDVIHAANTAGAILYPQARYGMVRCGIGLYGYLPGAAVGAAFTAASEGEELRPALSLRARVVSVRTLAEGERPSYGRLRPVAPALGGGHGAHRVRRRRAAGTLRQRRQRAHRREAASTWPAW